MIDITTTHTAQIARAHAMLADLEGRLAANLTRNPELGSGTVEAFNNHIAAVRRLIARLSAA